MGKDYRRNSIEGNSVKKKSQRHEENDVFYKRPKIYKKKAVDINQVLDLENDPINEYRNLFSVDVNYDFQ